VADQTPRSEDALALVAGPYITSLRVPPELRELVRSTLQDLLTTDDRPTPYSASVELDPDGTYRIMADGRRYRSELAARHVPDSLVRMLLLAELDAHPERLHLHAGAVADRGRGVVVAGFSGNGKSTMVTTLVRDGFDYLTDERVAIDPHDLKVLGFSKPISLVGGSFNVFPALHPDVLGHGQATEWEWQVPASAIGSGRMLTELDAQLLVFVRYEADSDLHVEQVHPLTAVARLLHDSPDIARFGADALHLCGRLCASVLCVEVRYSRPDDVGPALRMLLDETDRGVASREIEVIDARSVGKSSAPVIDHVVGTDRVRRTDAHTILLIDGRALVHDEQTQQLLELDESSTAWMMLVDGSTLDELIDAVSAETSTPRSAVAAAALQALNGLAQRGLVRTAS
jgi:hypothetical protein